MMPLVPPPNSLIKAVLVFEVTAVPLCCLAIVLVGQDLRRRHITCLGWERVKLPWHPARFVMGESSRIASNRHSSVQIVIASLRAP